MPNSVKTFYISSAIARIAPYVLKALTILSDTNVRRSSVDRDLSPTFLNTRTADETFQQFGKQDSFRYILDSSAKIYESSGSQFFRTTTGMLSGSGGLINQGSL